MSFRERFNFPYVTSSLPSWPPTSVGVGSEVEEYVLSPGEEPSRILNTFPVVKLQRGATYHWHDLDLNNSVTIYGNGATIRCPPVSYCLRITSSGTKIFDCVFMGKKGVRSGDALDENAFFAIWLHNGLSCFISGCSFNDFSGGALCVYSYGDVRSGNHVVDKCTFSDCKAGIVMISGGGDLVDGGLINFCRFEGCQYGIYVVSMFGWRIRDCMFSGTRSGVFHVRRDLMSYGDGLVGKQAFGGFGIVTGCFFRNSILSDWPKNVKLIDGSSIDLASFYFDDVNSIPIRVTDCSFLDSDMTIGEISKSPDYGLNFVLGCSFWYTGTDNTSSFDVIKKINGQSDSTIYLYLSACSGRDGCKVSGIKRGMLDDESFVSGLSNRGFICNK